MSNNMGFGLSIKDYAEQRGKTVQAVYQQMKRKENAQALNGHIFTRKVGNKDVKFLDEEAIRILDEGSGATPNIVLQEDLKDELQQSKRESDAWKLEAAKYKGQVDLLKEMLEEKENALHLLEEPKKQIDDLKAQNVDLSAEIKKRDKILEEERKTAQKLADELTALKNASLIKRIFGWKKGE